jgi:hypothetical protein
MRVSLLACVIVAAAACGSRVCGQDDQPSPCQCQSCAAEPGFKPACKQGQCGQKGCGCGQKGCKTGLCNHPPKHGNKAAQYRAAQAPWHGGYYYTQWGAPVALLIPPTAEMHTDYAWGVPSTRISRNDHQFQRPYPGNGYGGGYGFLPTPQYPSDTQQFGVYYVRGPW